MLGAVMSRHNCWNCDYRLEGDPSRCPRCGMPLAGLDVPREPAAAAATGAGPARTRSRRKAAPRADAKAQSPAQPAAPRAEVIPPGTPRRSATARIASGAGKGLRLAATGAGRGLMASLGIARKSVATGTALSVKTVKLVGSAAGGVASGVRTGGTKLIAYRPQRANQVLEGDILQRENVRTIADVAERLLRETREENARLAARIAALEARFAADRIGSKPASTGRKSASPAGTAPASALQKVRAGGNSRSTANRAERSAPREPNTGTRPMITLEARAEPAKSMNSHAEPAAGAKPAATSAKPEAASQKPAPAAAKPEAASPKPAPAAAKAEAASPKPAPAAAKPEAASQKPAPAAAKPEAASPKPAPAAAKPEASTGKPAPTPSGPAAKARTAARRRTAG